MPDDGSVGSLPALGGGFLPLREAVAHSELRPFRVRSSVSASDMERMLAAGMPPQEIGRVGVPEDGEWAALAGEMAGLWFWSASTWRGEFALPLGGGDEEEDLPENPAEAQDFLMLRLRAGSRLSEDDALSWAQGRMGALEMTRDEGLTLGDVSLVMLVRERLFAARERVRRVEDA